MKGGDSGGFINPLKYQGVFRKKQLNERTAKL
jgi:hypothetical protein